MTPISTYRLFKNSLATRLMGCLFACMLLFSTSVPAQPITREYSIKGVFLFNFTQYVEWPAPSFNHLERAFVIGILGADPFGSYLDQMVSGEKVKGLPIIIRRYTDPKDVQGCQILFISNKESGQLKQILNNVPKNILTVSDMEAFATGGGMIRLVTENNHIKLQVNLKAVRDGNLSISSKLLRLADIINP